MATETDLAYIAGINGKGYIGIKKSKAYKSAAHGMSPSVSFRARRAIMQHAP